MLFEKQTAGADFNVKVLLINIAAVWADIHIESLSGLSAAQAAGVCYTKSNTV